MPQGPNDLETRVSALETVVIEMLQLADRRDPDLYMHIMQSLNDCIRDTDMAEGIPEDEVNADKPKAPVSKCIKAIRDQFK